MEVSDGLAGSERPRVNPDQIDLTAEGWRNVQYSRAANVADVWLEPPVAEEPLRSAVTELAVDHKADDLGSTIHNRNDMMRGVGGD